MYPGVFQSSQAAVMCAGVCPTNLHPCHNSVWPHTPLFIFFLVGVPLNSTSTSTSTSKDWAIVFLMKHVQKGKQTNTLFDQSKRHNILGKFKVVYEKFYARSLLSHFGAQNQLRCQIRWLTSVVQSIVVICNSSSEYEPLTVMYIHIL